MDVFPRDSPWPRIGHADSGSRERPMTEAEWLAATDPAKCVHFLIGKGRERKLLLGACACCRTVENRYHLPEAKAALNHCELLADEPNNNVIREELVRLSREFRSFGQSRGWVIEERNALNALADAIHLARTPEYDDLAEYRASVCHVGISLLEPSNVLRKTQLFRVLRCVFGDPFRPVAVESEWLTSTVIALATGIYSEKAFDRMPILADALQDAGCDSADVLDHCRGPGPHVRGCWVVDLVLGKE